MNTRPLSGSTKATELELQLETFQIGHDSGDSFEWKTILCAKNRLAVHTSKLLINTLYTSISQ